MNNVLAKQNDNANTVLMNIKHGIRNVRDTTPMTSQRPILRMLKDGTWVYGQENIEVEEYSNWAFNTASIEYGYVCWTNKEKGEGNNELLGEVYAPITAKEPIDINSLPDKGWPWRPARKVDLLCVKGEDKNTEVTYKTSSIGGLNAIDLLLDAVDIQLDEGNDTIIPIAILASGHYQHKQHGKTYYPVFDVINWVSLKDPVGTGLDEDAPQVVDQEATAEPETNQIDTPQDVKKPITKGRVRRRRSS